MASCFDYLLMRAPQRALRVVTTMFTSLLMPLDVAGVIVARQ